MQRLNIGLFLLSAIVACCCAAGADSINADLVNNNVERTVDLVTHLPKITDSITLENSGKSSVNYFLFAVDPVLSDHLSFIGASLKAGDEDKLTVTATTVSGQAGKSLYRVDLLTSLEAGKQVTVVVETVYSHTLKPYPSQITQSEKQFVQFTANLYYYSPYSTTSQKTSVNCATPTIESYTRTSPVSTAGSAVIYGPYENKPAFSLGELVVHSENNNPFLSVTQLTRLIEVSHWGNVAVEETYDLLHTGAKLKGSFSRYDYQRAQDASPSVKSFKTVLPAAARDVYYRDEIGNISTSHLQERDDMVEMEIRPRFPLFGGWKTHYYIGYNVPSYQYLYQSGEQYVLKMRFIDHVFDDQVIDQATIRIMLPEGCSNVEVKAPFSVTRGPDEVFHTYLDTVGRPVVVIHKSNLVEQHIQDFQVHYTFNKLLLLQEPLLVVGAFYLLFLTVIIYVRLDFSITKDEASESRQRVSGLVEQVQGVQDRRSALYQSYEDAINKYKSSKDGSSFQANRKKIDADYKLLTQQIAGLLTKLKAEGSDVADKVAELQRLDGLVREQTTVALQSAEKLIANKINKAQYLETEHSIRTKRDDIYQRMETLLSAL